MILWYSELSVIGTSTLANVVEKRPAAMGKQTDKLGGEYGRRGLNSELGIN